MLFSSALVSLSLLGATSALAVEPRDAKAPLYARADIKSPGSDTIHATIEFTGYLDGRGTAIKVKVLSGLTNGELAPYPYHLHTNPVDASGNCSTALGHLDPLHYTDSVVCDPKRPQNCQEGDLSGKHGKLAGSADGSMKAFGYTDDYVRFFPEDHSILGRSVVIHAANKTRIACGNIISLLDGTAKVDKNGKWQPTGKPSTYTKNYPTAPYPNPVQTGVTPFVNGKGPLISVLKTMTFPLANTALSIRKALYIKTEDKPTRKWVDGVQKTVTLPREKKVNPFKLPFH